MAKRKSKQKIVKKILPNSKNKTKIFFDYLGYLGIVIGVIGIILLLLKIIGVF